MVLKTVTMYSPDSETYLVNEADVDDYKAKGFTQKKKTATKAAKTDTSTPKE